MSAVLASKRRTVQTTLTAIILFVLVFVSVSALADPIPVPPNLKPPAADGIWLRPAAGGPAEPVIGFKDGIRIGLWPTRGPRGVIRVIAPYVFPGHKREVINFIAIEPIVGGWRSLSELEHSKLDKAQGKRLWFSEAMSRSPTPALPWEPARGKIAKGRSVQTLSVVLNIEKLDNGAHPIVVVTFRSDRPHEIGFRIYAAKDSAPMESCVLSATMGNYSRTRLLWLKDEVVDSRKLWPDFTGEGFAEPREFGLDRLQSDADGTITVAITPNEKNLAKAPMPPGGWTFAGLAATQYWRKYPGTAKPDLRARVNGRAVYWGTSAPIPGGVAFENFELIERFRPGVESWFGVSLGKPDPPFRRRG